MKLILNIGLARAGKPDIGPCVALTAVREAGFTTDATKLDVSDTERTLIVETEWHGDYTLLDRTAEKVADWLEQDCIAVCTPCFGSGKLIGPRADKWGAFNPAFFIMPDGRRLSHHLGA